MSPRIVLYTTTYCGYCHAARRLLARRAIPFSEVDVTGDGEARRRLAERAGGRTTVPVVFIDGELIGGYDELAALDRAGGLAGLADAAAAGG